MADSDQTTQIIESTGPSPAQRRAILTWRRNHPEKWKNIHRRWSDAHPERCRAARRRWRKAHPEKWKAIRKRAIEARRQRLMRTTTITTPETSISPRALAVERVINEGIKRRARRHAIIVDEWFGEYSDRVRPYFLTTSCLLMKVEYLIREFSESDGPGSEIVGRCWQLLAYIRQFMGKHLWAESEWVDGHLCFVAKSPRPEEIKVLMRNHPKAIMRHATGPSRKSGVGDISVPEDPLLAAVEC